MNESIISEKLCVQGISKHLISAFTGYRALVSLLATPTQRLEVQTLYLQIHPKTDLFTLEKCEEKISTIAVVSLQFMHFVFHKEEISNFSLTLKLFRDIRVCGRVSYSFHKAHELLQQAVKVMQYTAAARCYTSLYQTIKITAPACSSLLNMRKCKCLMCQMSDL